MNQKPDFSNFQKSFGRNPSVFASPEAKGTTSTSALHTSEAAGLVPLPPVSSESARALIKRRRASKLQYTVRDLSSAATTALRLELLPLDMVLEYFSYCDLRSLLVLARISSDFYVALDHERAWRIRPSLNGRPSHQLTVKTLVSNAIPLAGQLLCPDTLPLSEVAQPHEVTRRIVVLQSAHSSVYHPQSLLAQHADVVWLSIATSQENQAATEIRRQRLHAIKRGFAFSEQNIQRYFPAYDATLELLALQSIVHLHTLLISYNLAERDSGMRFISNRELQLLLSLPHVRKSIRSLIVQSPYVRLETGQYARVLLNQLPRLCAGSLSAIGASCIRSLCVHPDVLDVGVLPLLPTLMPQLEQLVWDHLAREKVGPRLLSDLLTLAHCTNLRSLSLTVSSEWRANPGNSVIHHKLPALLSGSHSLAACLEVLSLNMRDTTSVVLWYNCLSSLQNLQVLRVQSREIRHLMKALSTLLCGATLAQASTSPPGKSLPRLRHLVLVDDECALLDGHSSLLWLQERHPGIPCPAHFCDLAMWQEFFDTIPRTSPLQVHFRMGAQRSFETAPFTFDQQRRIITQTDLFTLASRNRYRLRLWADCEVELAPLGNLSRLDMLGEAGTVFYNSPTTTILNVLSSTRLLELRQTLMQLPVGEGDCQQTNRELHEEWCAKLTRLPTWCPLSQPSLVPEEFHLHHTPAIHISTRS